MINYSPHKITRMIEDRICPSCGYEDYSIHLCDECDEKVYICGCCKDNHIHIMDNTT